MLITMIRQTLHPVSVDERYCQSNTQSHKSLTKASWLKAVHLTKISHKVFFLFLLTAKNAYAILVKHSVRWRFSSVGRASALQAEGQRFEPVNLHHVPT